MHYCASAHSADIYAPERVDRRNVRRCKEHCAADPYCTSFDVTNAYHKAFYGKFDAPFQCILNRDTAFIPMDTKPYDKPSYERVCYIIERNLYWDHYE
jgi:hypothetical protein